MKLWVRLNEKCPVTCHFVVSAYVMSMWLGGQQGRRERCRHEWSGENSSKNLPCQKKNKTIFAFWRSYILNVDCIILFFLNEKKWLGDLRVLHFADWCSLKFQLNSWNRKTRWRDAKISVLAKKNLDDFRILQSDLEYAETQWYKIFFLRCKKITMWRFWLMI